MKFLILGCCIFIFYKHKLKSAHYLATFQKRIMEIGHIEHEISTFSVPGRKMPAGDVSGEIIYLTQGKLPVRQENTRIIILFQFSPFLRTNKSCRPVF